MSKPVSADKERSDRGCTVPDGEPVPIVKGSHVYLIDGSGYIFRAFHALPPLTRASDGLPVGAVSGFCNMLWKLLRESKASEAPTHIAVIFDAGRETFRNEIYDAYKSNRPPPPEELIPQFGLIRDAVAAFNVACVELDGFEADDIIATYARHAVSKGGDVTIISSDKDLMQLVRPGVSMYDGMKSKRIGRDEVIEKFGVPPEKVIDVQSLAGDSVDNVPGVPGIGIKTAAELINEYGDLDALLERAGEIKQPKRREKLIEFAGQARISRDLVRLKDDVDGIPEVHALGVQDAKPDQLMAFLQLMEFTTLTKRIATAFGTSVPDPAPRAKPTEAPSKGSTPVTQALDGATPAAGARAHTVAIAALAFNPSKYRIIGNAAELNDLITAARESGTLALRIHAAPEGSIAGFALSTSVGSAAYVPVGHVAGGADLFGAGSGLQPGQLASRTVLAALKPILEDAGIIKIGHNIKAETLALLRQDVRLSPVDDVMLMSYATEGGRGGHGLDEMTTRHLNHTLASVQAVIDTAPGAKKADKIFASVPFEAAAPAASEEADAILRLWRVLKPRLVADRLSTVYETLERPLVPVIAQMELVGIKVDKQILARLSSTFAQRIAELEDEVQKLAGHKFNLGSPKQLGELLFDTLKLPGGKKTKSGQWETRAGLLDELAANEELPEDARRLINTMLEWRQLTKLRSTYTDALPGFIDPATGRIHTNYAMAATTTGRLSSSDPNLQNIPVRTKEGREIRTAFIAEKGMTLVSADYSQIELRVLAHMADIPQLKKAFANGLDIHAMTASEMFGVPLKEMTGEIRRRAKAINFGIIYGISAFGLANQLGISREDAGNYIKTYFQRFPGIRDYMETTKKTAHDKGYVETIFGRRVHYPEINTKNPSMRGFLERAAINAPIQGSAADIIRRAMIRIPDALKAAQIKTARMLLQVHDELIFEVKLDEAEHLITLARGIMEGAAEPAVKMAVPIHVDAKAALNWDAAH